MIATKVIFQLIIGLGLLNVWLLRFNKETLYRGGKAKNLLQEFATYGLPSWFCYTIGFLKVSAAIALIAGIWFPFLVPPAAGLVAVLMAGAVSMHVKVSDPIKKSVPAISVLSLSALLLVL